MSQKQKLKYKSDFDKGVIINNCEQRGWIRTYDDDWNVFWACVGSVKHLFNPESGFKFSDNQIVNHFPNHFELTRKDLLVKNIKRYKKECEKLDDSGKKHIIEYLPTSYILPGDYSLFVEEYKKAPNSVWIMKPNAKARGIGIFLVTKLNQIKKWAKDRWAHVAFKDQYVISKYLNNPLLVGGRKFDLRLYTLVTSYRPLKVYMHKDGFARFCTSKYSNDINDLENMFVHLTNVAVQKHGEEYNEKHGGKWHVNNLRSYLEGTRGKEATDKMFSEIKFIVIQSLKACQNIIINDRHCFEVYGYDIIIDANLKPWLLEVNASPSFSTTTKMDRIIKHSMIGDALDIVVHADFPEKMYRDYKFDNEEIDLSTNQFELICDEMNEEEIHSLTPGPGNRTLSKTPVKRGVRPASKSNYRNYP